LLITVFATAQTRLLEGKIVSASDQQAVSKASITIKNGRSFIANDSGRFTIEAPVGDFILNVSSIGFASKEVAVKPTDNNLTIPLTEIDKNLNEVVVVGYNAKKKGELTSSVAV